MGSLQGCSLLDFLSSAGPELAFSAFPLQGLVDFVIFIFICFCTLTKFVPPYADSGSNWGNVVSLELGAGIHP